jgi:type IV pilus assembly protein PilO
VEQQLDRLAKLPLPTRLGALVALVAVISGLNFFLVIQDVEAKLQKRTTERASLEKDLAEKTALANNLNKHLQEMEELETRLSEALTELPEQRDIDEILGSLHDIGKRVGLLISTIEPLAEQRDAKNANFVARIPIRMRVQGNYHEVALFFQELGNLRRIVNVGSIRLGRPEMRAEKVMLETDFVATAFRFVPTQAGNKKKGKK